MIKSSLLVILFLFCSMLQDHAVCSVSLCFTGDIMLDRGVRDMVNLYGPDYPFTSVRNKLNSADITFGNLECPLTNRGTPSNNSIILKGDPSNADVLRDSGYSILNIANNHMMDYGIKGLDDTIEALKKSHIEHVDENPLIIKKHGIRVGMIGYSALTPENLKGETVIEGLKNLRQSCDFLVVSFHTGREYNHYPTEMQKKYSRLFIDYGADIVIGHHPHVLQGYEIYKGKYIFYSLGNFVFDKQIQEGTDESIILNVKINRSGVSKIEILPVRITKCQPQIVNGDESKSIVQTLKSYVPSF